MNDLREKALSAWYAARESERRYQERQRIGQKERASRRASKALEMEFTPADVADDLTITKDGVSVRFCNESDGEWELRAVLTCCCGRETTGQLIHSLADLGEMLAQDETPDGCRYCNPAPPSHQTTPAEALIAALDAYIEARQSA